MRSFVSFFKHLFFVFQCFVQQKLVRSTSRTSQKQVSSESITAGTAASSTGISASNQVLSSLSQYLSYTNLIP